uniref:NADH dehydrogenase subunit 6 n=1 Tax=Pristolycus diversecostatus TaxID=2985487 RepID=UPI0022375821|nr:NADH dehydrogenase subunit 6 [Pristolycus diversecostatus]UYE92367.1 NADH dehydrogenase subunit 6 [Pristolycus diversecostatus]
MTLLMYMTMMTIMFMFISHPLTMGMILLIQTLLIAMYTGYISMNLWFSYILFIIMVGGMLILFIYMTSVASNEKFSYSKMMMILMMMFIMVSMWIMKDQLMMMMNSMNLDLMTKKIIFKMSLNKFLMYPMMMMSASIIIYLLMALVAVSKITNIKNGPLRKNI